jgi:hypothetical protein
VGVVASVRAFLPAKFLEVMDAFGRAYPSLRA